MLNLIVCDSAHTRVTAVLMSMAMPSILKVFFMRTTEGEGYDAKQGNKRGRRRGREVVRGQGKL